MTKTTTGITGIRTVGVPVTDQDGALAFYAGVLGFETRTDAVFGEGLRWIEVAPPGASTTVALMPHGEQSVVGIDTNIRFAAPDVDALHASLRHAGVDVDAEVMRWGGPVPPMFTLRDPDGNNLVVVEQPAD